MKKHIVTYCPFYDLTSPVLLAAMNVVDVRSVRARLDRAGVPIRYLGEREVVRTDELLAALDDGQVMKIEKVVPKSELSKSLLTDV